MSANFPADAADELISVYVSIPFPAGIATRVCKHFMQAMKLPHTQVLPQVPRPVISPNRTEPPALPCCFPFSYLLPPSLFVHVFPVIRLVRKEPIAAVDQSHKSVFYKISFHFAALLFLYGHILQQKVSDNQDSVNFFEFNALRSKATFSFLFSLFFLIWKRQFKRKAKRKKWKEKKTKRNDNFLTEIVVSFWAQRVGFEPTVLLPVHLISSQGRYNHFDTAAYCCAIISDEERKIKCKRKQRLRIYSANVILASQNIFSGRILCE